MKKYMIPLIVGSLCIGMFGCGRGTPSSAEEILQYASANMSGYSYIEAEAEYLCKGVQGEENIDAYVNTNYKYDKSNDVCEATMKYSTNLGDGDTRETVKIWTVGEESSENGQDSADKDSVTDEEDASGNTEDVEEVVAEKDYYTYSCKEGSEDWEKTNINKTNQEMYGQNIFQMILDDADSKLTLKEDKKKKDGQSCYVVEANVSAFLAHMITKEVDLASACTGNSAVTYDVNLYFDSSWTPVCVEMDFCDEVEQDGKDRGLTVLMDEGIYRLTYNKLSTLLSVKLPEDIAKKAVSFQKTYENATQEPVKNDEEIEIRQSDFPITIGSESSFYVTINKIDEMVVNPQLTTSESVMLQEKEDTDYHEIEVIVPNVEAETDAKMHELLEKSVSDIKDYLAGNQSYSQVESGEWTKLNTDKYDVSYISMSYIYQDSEFTETTALVKVDDMKYLKIRIMECKDTSTLDIQSVINTVVSNIVVQ